jgi:hypothetical protein
MAPYFERTSNQLRHDDRLGRAHPVTGRQGSNLKANATEFKATALWHPRITQTDAGTVCEPDWCHDAHSLLNKLVVGHPAVLAKAGVPAVTIYLLPVAHVQESWAINPHTFHIEAVRTLAPLSDVDEVDAVEFFTRLYKNGRLPLASESDVLLFVMLLATPLLRHVASGQLGVYWIIGASGAGKDYIAELSCEVWASCLPSAAPVSFDLNLAGDLELKRSLEMANGAVFARAKEAGKRPGMADMLIRLAGTNNLTVRGLYKDDVTIPNAFTYVAESVEDLPDRREISRRTVLIRVAFMADSISKGLVLDEVRANAKGLLKNLKRVVESKPATWYTGQTDTGSRPLVAAALAKLLGVALPAVEGEDLTDIFEAMVAFATSAEGKLEGSLQLKSMEARTSRASLEVRTLPSYRFSLFIEVMSEKPGNAELFSPYARKSNELVTRIKRESEYRTAIATQGYLLVKVDGKGYALRIEDRRRFVLLLESDFKARMLVARAAAASATNPPPATADGGAAVQPWMPISDSEASELAHEMQCEMLLETLRTKPCD